MDWAHHIHPSVNLNILFLPKDSSKFVLDFTEISVIWFNGEKILCLHNEFIRVKIGTRYRRHFKLLSIVCLLVFFPMW
ncbi:hypothetical protein DV733_02485 [Halapricum salinum]|uniref:Uncharacterized protein n=1 Tax=Halapricum salinum TaxID=1457250 RepID=A0A4D6H949_9EURY|nr:hypothetical protein DV733_02485 [Halapricum salinum]